MRIASPLLLVLGILVVGALVAAAVTITRRRSAVLAAAGATTGRRPGLGLWLTLAGVAVLAVAIAGPSASVPVPRSTGTLIVAVDVSNSMGAKDVSPSRLAAAQKAAVALIDAQPTNVKIGVVAFQDGALTTSMPSTDHGKAATAVDRLRISGGTSLAAAILTSLRTITGKPVTIRKDGTIGDLGYWPSATIVLLSDGEDPSAAQSGPRSPQTAATAAQKAGVHIDTVGVGTSGGTTVDVDGFRLHTALDEKSLSDVARITGGHYHPGGDAGALKQVADAVNLRLTVADEQLPLAGALCAAALVLLAVGAALTVRRTGRII